MMESVSGRMERMYHQMDTPDIPRLEGRLYLFGRTAPRNGMEEVIVCQSDFVSRKHCSVSFKNGAFWIQDMKSLNGTYLNDERLLPLVDRELRFGDRIGLGVCHDTPDLAPEDPSVFIFIFKKVEYEVIDIDDDDEPLSVRGRSSSIEILNEEADPPLDKKPLPAPPPPPILGPDPAPVEIPAVTSLKPRAIANTPSATPSLLVRTPQTVAEVKPNPATAPPISLEPQASTSKASFASSTLPPSQNKILASAQKSGQTNKPGPASFHRRQEPENNPKKNQTVANTSNSNSTNTKHKNQEKTKKDQILTPSLPPHHNVQPELINTKKQTSPPVHPQGMKRKVDSTDDFGIVKRKQSLPQSTESATQRKVSADRFLANTSSSTTTHSSLNLPIPAVAKCVAPNSKSKQRISLERFSSSGDDSSDGLQSESASARVSSNNRCRVPETQQEVTPAADDDESSKLCVLTDANPAPNPFSPNPDIGQLKPKLDKKCSNAALRLRQLIRLVGGTPSIRKCKFTVLSDSNREKICKQWNASRKRCKKAQIKPSRYSTTSDSQSLSDSDSSEDCIIPPVVIKKKKSKTQAKRNSPPNPPKSTGGSTNRADKKASTPKSSSDDDAADDSPKRKRSKVSKTEEKANQPSHNNEVLDSPEQLFSYSQPYESPDHALSPISSDDMNVDQNSPLRPRMNSCSDISEDGDIHGRGPSPSSSPTYNPPSSPSAVSPPIEDTKKTQGGRQLKRIDDAPLPREFRNKNGALERGRQEQSKNVASTAPKQNQSMKERLKKIAEAECNRSAVPHDSSTGLPKLTRAPVNIKTTKKNRNEELFTSIMASAGGNKNSKDDDELVEPVVQQNESSTIPTNNNKIPAIPAPRREIPLPSPTTQAQMPVNQISSSMTLQHQQSNSRKLAPQPPKPPIRLPEKPVNRMEKPGVTLARQESNKRVYEYGHKSTIPQQPAQSNLGNSRAIVPILEDDAGYKCLLKWRPAWLEEQKKVKIHPPPVTGDWATVRTLLHYEDYNSYAQTFFPLMLLETWASVTQDYSSKRRVMERESETGLVMELPVVITNCQKTGVCPMTDVRWRDRVAKTREKYYTVVDCYAIINNPRDISQKRDLAICSFGIQCRDPNSKKVIEGKREFFGYLLTGSNNTTPITGNSIIHQELKNKNPGAKYILTFQVVIHSGDELDRAQMGTIQKIAYVSPKLRDIKALVHLKHSKLHNAIIQTQAAKSFWNPHAVISQHHLVQHVSKLNPVQKSAVAYITERVKSTTEELVLVHGPPGTGKTRTVVGMILQLLALKDFKGDKRLLICTPSNTALDEIMVRLEEAIKDLPSNDKIRMLRFGETEGSIMKKYSIEAYLRKIEDQNSMNVGIRKSIEICKKKIHTKESEISALEKNGGVKARIESLRRELTILIKECDAYTADLSKKKSETGSHSFEQKRRVLEKSNVIFSTLNSCGNHVLTGVFGSRSGRKTKPFMCCIVDESSQTTEPETLAPLLLQVDKLILVGDPNQLGATVLSQEAENREFGRSMFSRLFESSTDKHQSVVMLTQQYRMHPQILAWPNEYFYKGMLKTQCIGRSADDECYKLKPYLFLNLSSQETSNREGQISNEEEAKVVIGIIRNILAVLDSDTNSNKKFTIGVVTPYSTQKTAISNDVKREFSLRAEVEVDTVDSFQGKEKDIIIISCVRTDDIGFLNNPKRLNVALTRARHSLLIIGDADCLRKDIMWKSLIDNAKERKCLYNIPKTEWNVPGFLRKRLFQLLSPLKSQIPEDERRRYRL